MITKKYFIDYVANANKGNVFQFDSKQLFRVELDRENIIYLYSYKTIIGLIVNDICYLTIEKYSRTTTNHQTYLYKYYNGDGYSVQKVSPVEFAALLAENRV